VSVGQSVQRHLLYLLSPKLHNFLTINGQSNIIYWIKESARLMSKEESGHPGITVTEAVARKAA